MNNNNNNNINFSSGPFFPKPRLGTLDILSSVAGTQSSPSHFSSELTSRKRAQPESRSFDSDKDLMRRSPISSSIQDTSPQKDLTPSTVLLDKFLDDLRRFSACPPKDYVVNDIINFLNTHFNKYIDMAIRDQYPNITQMRFHAAIILSGIAQNQYEANDLLSAKDFLALSLNFFSSVTPHDPKNDYYALIFHKGVAYVRLALCNQQENDLHNAIYFLKHALNYLHIDPLSTKTPFKDKQLEWLGCVYNHMGYIEYLNGAHYENVKFYYLEAIAVLGQVSTDSDSHSYAREVREKLLEVVKSFPINK